MSKGDGYEPSKEEKEYLESISEKYKDPYGMYYNLFHVLYKLIFWWR